MLRGSLTPPQRSICSGAAQTLREHVGRSLAGWNERDKNRYASSAISHAIAPH
jgi:hypothetical protein